MACNDRLRTTLAARGVDVGGLAQRVQVDPKTVERWISSGRTPYRAHRHRVAVELGVDEAYLWPEAVGVARDDAATCAELVAFHANRGQVPAGFWSAMVRGAKDCVNLLVYAGLFWVDAHPDIPDTLNARAAAGVSVRLALGDPDSPAVAARGVEEGIDMAGRVRIALGLLEPLVGQPGIEVRLHDTTLYASMYQVDDILLANTHVYGASAASSPVLHLQQHPGGRLFEHYHRSFEKVWAHARPIG